MAYQQQERPFLLRALYFLFIGLWLTLIWIYVAWALMATIILLPLGLWMVNRVPQVLTLKRVPQEAELTTYENTVTVRMRAIRQPSWILRLLYFLFIGWWFGPIWATAGWVLCAIIIGLPLGIPMLNNLPLVTTLTRT